MLKRTITSAEYDALPDDVKAHYVKRGTSYAIDLEGADPELVSTQKALDTERTKNINLESQVRTLTEEAKTTEERVRKEVEGDVKKLTEQNKKLIDARVDSERKMHTDKIAANFKTENLIRSDLRDRIVVEVNDGEITTKFLDKDGKEVDFKTLNDEYCKNPDYSAILKTNANTSTFEPPKQPQGGNNNDKGGSGGDGNLDYNRGDVREIANRLNQIQ